MPALIISTPETMSRVRVLTVKDQSEQALKILQRIGVLHVDEARELRPFDRAALEKERSEVGELLGFVDAVLSHIPAKERDLLGGDVEVVYTLPYSEISAEVRALYNKTNLLVERSARISAERERLQALQRYLAPIGRMADLRLKDLAFSGEYIVSNVYILPSDAYAAASGRLNGSLLKAVTAVVDNETVVYSLVRSKDRDTVGSIFNEAGGRALEVPSDDRNVAEFLAETGKTIQSVEEELEGLREEIRSKVRDDLRRLVLLKEALAAESDQLAVLEKAAETRYVSLIEGWVPDSDVPSAISGIREGVRFAFVDTRPPEPGEEPPSKQNNAKPLRPFELIIKILEIPKYRGWDPTPVVAYSFAFFFGIMLGDVIYGLGLILAARFGLPNFVDDPSSNNFKMFQRLIYTCSSVAIAIGVMNGSYMGDVYTLFGIKSMTLVPGIARLMGDPLSFVIFAILVGLVHVNVAHLLALIKGIKDRNKGVILNRAGLFLLQFGFPGLLRGMLKINIAFIPVEAYPYLSYAMYAGILSIIVSNMIMSGGTGMFLWIFDITGIFGDVVSYARLAGVGLASFYLGKSFNLIATLFGHIFPGALGAVIGTAAGIGLFIVGHAANIMLGGMGCFVHSLRLCFVEFLTKFYEGGGQEYDPFRIRKRAM